MTTIITRKYRRDRDLNRSYDYGWLSLHTVWILHTRGYAAKCRRYYLVTRRAGVKTRQITRKQFQECLKNFFVQARGKSDVIL